MRCPQVLERILIYNLSVVTNEISIEIGKRLRVVAKFIQRIWRRNQRYFDREDMRGCLFLHIINCNIKIKIVKTERDRQTDKQM